MEYHYGKLKPVDKLENETFEEFAERICKEKNIDIDYVKSSGYDSFLEYILVELEYVYNGSCNVLYEIYDHQSLEDEYFMFKEIGSNNFEFGGGFYNGGTCLTEVLEDCITNHLKEKKWIKN